VAGFGARWVSREDVPDDVLVKEREIYEAKALQEDKPEKIIPRIVEAQVEDFLKHNCLLEQEYFRESGHTVQQLIAEYISKLQENITVRRFARFNIREN
jgi:elongation factor Ts